MSLFKYVHNCISHIPFPFTYSSLPKQNYKIYLAELVKAYDDNLVFLFATMVLFYPTVVCSQIIPDRTLPHNSTVTVNENQVKIEGGTIRGSNLFHSFTQFSLNSPGIESNINQAYFNNGLDITQIFSRVTGNSVSEINGLIKTNGSADLFLLNPNGIIFGKDAVLDIGGSLIVTTADSLQFGDGTEFSSVNPQADALLSVNIPVGLQYGSKPQDIKVLGVENEFTFDRNQEIIHPSNNLGLEVSGENSLVLVGGNVDLTGGSLSVPQGRIDLGAVSKDEIVELNLDSSGWQADYGGVENFNQINFNQAASIVGEIIKLTGDEVNLTENSSIFSQRLNDVAINSNLLSLHDAQIYLTTNSEIDARGLTLDSPEISLENSSIYSLVAETAEGNGAKININSDLLILKERSQITLDTLGMGNGGDLNIHGREININNHSAIEAKAIVDIGKGGNITISADSLSLEDGARIHTGNLLATISHDSLHTLKASSLNYTIIGMGEVGNIAIDANSLTLDGGSQISTSTFAAGGGIVQLNSDRISLFDDSQIITETKGKSHGGGIYLVSENLNFDQDTAISTHTYGEGNAGKISLQVHNAIVTEGQNNIYSQTHSSGSQGKIGITGNIISLGNKVGQLGNIRLIGGNWVDLSFDRGVNIPLNNNSLISSDCFRQSNYATTINRRIAAQNLEGIEGHQVPIANSLVEAQGWIVNSAGNVELLALSCP